MWTTRWGGTRERREQAGHPSRVQLARETVSKILSRAQLRQHKIEYCQGKRDPEFEQKVAQVLVVCKLVELAHQRAQVRGKTGQAAGEPWTVFVSYDEKPGIQATGVVAPDRARQPGKHAATGRD